MAKTGLWTKNFTIITLGSAVSILGNAMSGFAVSILALDKTGSPFLYALFLAAYGLPQMLVPLIAGPILDKRSRRKAVYTLDFLSAAMFLIMFLIVKSGYYNYGAYLAFTFVCGAIDSFYIVAYDSFYPMLVPEGYYAKAYSVSSLLYPLAVMMSPVAAYIYKTVGLGPLFAFDAISFFAAAVCETQIKVDEVHLQQAEPKRLTVSDFRADFKKGLDYVRGEKGLSTIVVYFMLNSFLYMGCETLWLPFFKSIPALGVMAYSYVVSANVVGRLIGGGLQYKFRYPKEKKFAIALAVYVLLNFVDGAVLLMPYALMLVFFFADGLLGSTSFNIRTSTTQSYLPETVRGRFNGILNMAMNAGTFTGSLVAGALAEKFSIRPICIAFMATNLVVIYFVMYRGRKDVAFIYNRDV